MPAVAFSFLAWKFPRRNTWHIGQPISNYPPSLYVIGTVFSAHLAFHTAAQESKIRSLHWAAKLKRWKDGSVLPVHRAVSEWVPEFFVVCFPRAKITRHQKTRVQSAGNELTEFSGRSAWFDRRRRKDLLQRALARTVIWPKPTSGWAI